jgi:hypothetical protein
MADPARFELTTSAFGGCAPIPTFDHYGTRLKRQKVAHSQMASQLSHTIFDLSFLGTEAMQWSRRACRLLHCKGAHDGKEKDRR